MIVIEMPERGTLLKVSNDSKYQTVTIHCKDVDQTEEFALKIVGKFLNIEE